MNQKITMTWYERFMKEKVQHYNPRKYWKRRERVINFKGGGVFEKIICTYFLLTIKRADAFNNASFGTHLGKGATFKTVPHLPHGLYDIIISHNAVIGSNCCIYHQVTIGESDEKAISAPTIGDNCIIGAGAKIVGAITIGNNVKIGTNCIVNFDVPDNATVVLQKPRVILK